jgi:hypothetical protein
VTCCSGVIYENIDSAILQCCFCNGIGAFVGSQAYKTGAVKFIDKQVYVICAAAGDTTYEKSATQKFLNAIP